MTLMVFWHSGTSPVPPTTPGGPFPSRGKTTIPDSYFAQTKLRGEVNFKQLMKRRKQYESSGSSVSK